MNRSVVSKIENRSLNNVHTYSIFNLIENMDGSYYSGLNIERYQRKERILAAKHPDSDAWCRLPAYVVYLEINRYAASAIEPQQLLPGWPSAQIETLFKNDREKVMHLTRHCSPKPGTEVSRVRTFKDIYPKPRLDSGSSATQILRTQK